MLYSIYEDKKSQTLNTRDWIITKIELRMTTFCKLKKEKKKPPWRRDE